MTDGYLQLQDNKRDMLLNLIMYHIIISSMWRVLDYNLSIIEGTPLLKISHIRAVPTKYTKSLEFYMNNILIL